VGLRPGDVILDYSSVHGIAMGNTIPGFSSSVLIQAVERQDKLEIIRDGERVTLEMDQQ
jgi:hypothetical protein